MEQRNTTELFIPSNRQRILAKDTNGFCRGLQSLVNLSEPDSRAFDFCRRYTIENMAYGQLSHFWTSSVLSACHIEPAALHAMLALTAIHREHSTQSPLPLLVEMADAHYNKALGHLRQLSGMAVPQHELVLVVCLLLLTCDVFQTRYGSALLHLNNGRRIYQTMQAHRSSWTDLSVLNIPAQACSIQDELTYMMASIDLQSTNYGSLRPMFELVTESGGSANRNITIPQTFSSLDDAWRYMLIIYNKAAHLVPISTDSGNSQYLRNDVESFIQQGRLLSQLAAWQAAYEKSAFRSPSSSVSSEDCLFMCRTSHLQMLQALVEIAIATCLASGDEMQYDVYLPRFQTVVSLAEKIAPLLPAVTFDIGVVQPLFLLCAFCRDPSIRRRAITVLSRAGKEGYWDSKLVTLCSREKMLFEEMQAGYVHNPEHYLSQHVDLATLIPRSARYTETWAFYTNDDMRDLDIMFKRRKLRHGELQPGEQEWEMFSKRVQAPPVHSRNPH